VRGRDGADSMTKLLLEMAGALAIVGTFWLVLVVTP
jgi:hypothetical protein